MSINTIRTFFAIVPPSSQSDCLACVLESLKQSLPKNLIKWAKIDQLHITLQFLKSTKPEDLIPLIEQVRQELKNSPAFLLEFGGFEWFPSLKHPKILSLTVGPQTSLIPMSIAIGHAISTLNYPVESRPFRAHMSLGRLDHNPPQLEALLQEIKVPIIPPILIQELYLLESKLSNEGADYYPLAKLTLGINDKY